MYDGRHYKIGQSKNPTQRLKILQAGNPELKIIACGKAISEAKLHKFYKDKRIEREFFDLSGEDIANIINLINDESAQINVFNLIKDTYVFQRLERFTFKFGKFKNRRMIEMDNEEEVQYLQWVKQNFDNSWISLKELIDFYLIYREIIHKYYKK
jgi:hypothetical protein